jgi:tetratricopeptide (TPR) repeat protein
MLDLAKLEYLPDLVRVDKSMSWWERISGVVFGDIPFILSLALGGAGLFLARGRREAQLLGLWLAFCVAVAAVSPVDFIGARYRLPMMPFALFGCVAFFVGPVGGWISFRKHPWFVITLGACVALVLAELLFYQNVFAVGDRVVERDRLFLQAERAYSSEKFEEASRFYSKALKVQPDFLEARLGLGNSLLALGRPNEAAAYYEEAVRVNPADARARAGLGAIYRQRGQDEKAASQFEVASDATTMDWAFERLPLQPHARLDVGTLDVGYVSGFWPVQYDGETTYRRVKELALMRLKLRKATKYVTLRMVGAPQGVPLVVRIHLNGLKVAEATVGPVFEEYDFIVPESMRMAPEILVELKSDTFDDGGGSNVRRSGVAVDWVRASSEAGPSDG